MKTLNSKLSFVFYFLLAYAFILFVLPPDLTFGVYSFNLLGWSMVVSLVLSLIIYLYMFIRKLRGKQIKKFNVMTIFLLTIITISILFWVYQAKNVGNL